MESASSTTNDSVELTSPYTAPDSHWPERWGFEEFALNGAIHMILRRFVGRKGGPALFQEITTATAPLVRLYEQRQFLRWDQSALIH